MEIGIVLTIIFVALKLTHVIDWSWVWVLSPLWIGAMVGGIMFAVTGAVGFLVSRTGRKKQKSYIEGIEEEETEGTYSETRMAKRTKKVNVASVFMIGYPIFIIIAVMILLIEGTGSLFEGIIPFSAWAFAGSLIALILILAAITLVAGVFAWQRKRWGFVLAGAIILVLGFLPLGIPAVILVAIGKEEFKRLQPSYDPMQLPSATIETRTTSEHTLITCGACGRSFFVEKGQGIITVKCPHCQRESRITT
jgi:MFS family permease